MTLEDPNPVSIIWDAADIGKAIGKSKRQAFHLLETGQLKGATKVGSRWCITLQNLVSNFEPNAAYRLLEDLSAEDREAILAEFEE